MGYPLSLAPQRATRSLDLAPFSHLDPKRRRGTARSGAGAAYVHPGIIEGVRVGEVWVGRRPLVHAGGGRVGGAEGSVLGDAASRGIEHLHLHPLHSYFAL